jgi:hypothetical protein
MARSGSRAGFLAQASDPDPTSQEKGEPKLARVERIIPLSWKGVVHDGEVWLTNSY